MDKTLVNEAIDLLSQNLPQYIRSMSRFKDGTYESVDDESAALRTSQRIYILKVPDASKIQDPNELSKTMATQEEKLILNIINETKSPKMSDFNTYDYINKTIFEKHAESTKRRDLLDAITEATKVIKGFKANPLSLNWIITNNDNNILIKKCFLVAKNLAGNEVAIDVPNCLPAVSKIAVSNLCPADQLIFINTDVWEIHIISDWEYIKSRDCCECRIQIVCLKHDENMVITI